MRSPAGRPLLVALLATGVLAEPLVAQRLAGADSAAIDAGRQVVRAEDVPGSSWPRVTVYQYIAATPVEAAAVFVDYDRHAGFLPKVKKSQVSRVVDPSTAEVDYTLDVPIVSDESYTVRNRVTREVAADSTGADTFQVEWTLVRATTTKAADGSARFEPYRDGTLLTYRNLVVPGSRLAGLGFIRGRAQREVEATARALGERVLQMRTGDRTLLDEQVSALRTMTGAR